MLNRDEYLFDIDWNEKPTSDSMNFWEGVADQSFDVESIERNADSRSSL